VRCVYIVHTGLSTQNRNSVYIIKIIDFQQSEPKKKNKNKNERVYIKGHKIRGKKKKINYRILVALCRLLQG
jgi:hypothetical protein